MTKSAPDRPKPIAASRQTRLALRPSKSAQADLEPRPSFPSGAELGHKQSLRTDCAERRAEPLVRRGLQGRPAYPPDEGLS